jgi:hypothetical protein
MANREQALGFQETILEPVLASLGLGGGGASELLLGTALVESGLVHRRQLGGGPARGLFQMEPRTHDDIWDNFLRYRVELAARVQQLLNSESDDRHRALENNDRYAAAMARVHYLRMPAALPSPGDRRGQAEYWKRHYNTALGAGSVEKYLQAWSTTFGAL